MLNKLFRLYERSPKNTPLEDFTTEALVGVLNNSKALKRKFCNEFIGFKSRYYTIRSQRRYSLEDHQNCIVDIVIEGDKEICFIENKVNSKEGYMQLERYSLVLDEYENRDYNTKLVYITKRSEPKEINKHSFKQYKWYYIARFLKEHSSEQLTNLFLEFLKENKMAQELKLTSTDFVAIENFGRVFLFMYEHIDRLKGTFESKFGKIKDSRKGDQLKSQCERHDRFCIYSENVVSGKGWSEILYGFEFRGVMIVQIYIDADNESYASFKKKIDSQNEMHVEHCNGDGSVIYLEKNLGEYLNDDNSDTKIEEWFFESFQKIDDFKQETKDCINWR